MYSFEIIKGDSPYIVKVQQFLSEIGMNHSLVSQKMLNLKSNPDEEVFVIGKDKNEDIMGIVELTVEYKFTFGLSKMFHVDRVITGKGMSAIESTQLRVELKRFVIQSLNQSSCYKAVISENDEIFIQQHEKAGFKSNRIHMQFQPKDKVCNTQDVIPIK